MIRLNEGEMRAMNKTSVALKDGSGYAGYLESFHMLHWVVSSDMRDAGFHIIISRSACISRGIPSTMPILHGPVCLQYRTLVSTRWGQVTPRRDGSSEFDPDEGF